MDRTFCILALLVLLLSSCRPFYLPNAVNTPVFKQKGELQVSGQISSSGYTGQAGYAISDHAAVIANIEYQGFFNDSANKRLSHFYVEGGGGYYMNVGPKGTFEVFGGYGNGFTMNREYLGRYNRFFVQPDFGFNTKYMDVALASRFSVLNVYSFYNLGVDNRLNTNAVFWEPAATLRVGFRNAMFSLQAGAAVPFHKPKNLIFDYNPMILAVGIHLTFNTIPNPEVGKGVNDAY